MTHYLTSGHVARRLHVSVSTLKRWLAHVELPIENCRNSHGWRLFTESDVETLRAFKRKLKREGRCYHESTLCPAPQAFDDHRRFPVDEKPVGSLASYPEQTPQESPEQTPVQLPAQPLEQRVL